MIRTAFALSILLAATLIATANEGGSSLELVTFNIRYLKQDEKKPNHWDQRKQLVTDAIKEFDADILGLQEVLHQQLQDITADLPGYTAFGVGRDDGKTRGEYSPILFRSNRFQRDKQESGTFWLSDTPTRAGSKSWGNKLPRICTWARLTDTQSKTSFYVFNTHWDHQSQKSRLRAAKLILQQIEKRKHQKEPVILLGDFNAARDNPALQHLTKKLADTFTTANPDTREIGTFHHFKGLTTGRQIDHILTSSDIPVTSAKILQFQREGRYPSDHFPVSATLHLPDQSEK